MRRKISQGEKERVLARYGHCCANADGAALGWRCPLAPGTRLTPSTAQFDHITELADGGQDVHDNLQALCACCHDQKTRANLRRRAAALRSQVAPRVYQRCPRTWRRHFEEFVHVTGSGRSKAIEVHREFTRWCRRHGRPAPGLAAFRTHFAALLRSDDGSSPMEVDEA